MSGPFVKSLVASGLCLSVLGCELFEQKATPPRLWVLDSSGQTLSDGSPSVVSLEGNATVKLEADGQVRTIEIENKKPGFPIIDPQTAGLEEPMALPVIVALHEDLDDEWTEQLEKVGHHLCRLAFERFVFSDLEAAKQALDLKERLEHLDPGSSKNDIASIPSLRAQALLLIDHRVGPQGTDSPRYAARLFDLSYGRFVDRIGGYERSLIFEDYLDRKGDTAESAFDFFLAIIEALRASPRVQDYVAQLHQSPNSAELLAKDDTPVLGGVNLDVNEPDELDELQRLLFPDALPIIESPDLDNLTNAQNPDAEDEHLVPTPELEDPTDADASPEDSATSDPETEGENSS